MSSASPQGAETGQRCKNAASGSGLGFLPCSLIAVTLRDLAALCHPSMDSVNWAPQQKKQTQPLALSLDTLPQAKGKGCSGCGRRDGRQGSWRRSAQTQPTSPESAGCCGIMVCFFLLLGGAQGSEESKYQ